MEEKVTKIFEYVKKYQRPVRCIIWVVLISIAFIKCLNGKYDCGDSKIVDTILIGMFIDMGIYGYNRTREKIANFKKPVPEQN